MTLLANIVAGAIGALLLAVAAIVFLAPDRPRRRGAGQAVGNLPAADHHAADHHGGDAGGGAA
ncbi:MAG: hypothetical protein ACE369_18675 [Roseovarius sp.]